MISRAHQTIFVHIPKCGGRSIEQCFIDDLNLDKAGRARLLIGGNRDPKKGPPRLEHLTARDYVARGHVGAEDFARHYRFAVLRDPLERVLSMYNFLKGTLAARAAPSTRRAGPMSFDRFVESFLPHAFSEARAALVAATPKTTGFYWFLRPQAEYVLDPSGDLLVEDLFDLRRIDAGFERIKARTGLTGALPHLNRSRRAISAADVSPRTRARVEDLYRADYALLASSQVA